MGSIARIGYCTPVPDFYLVLHDLEKALQSINWTVLMGIAHVVVVYSVLESTYEIKDAMTQSFNQLKIIWRKLLSINGKLLIIAYQLIMNPTSEVKTSFQENYSSDNELYNWIVLDYVDSLFLHSRGSLNLFALGALHLYQKRISLIFALFRNSEVKT